MKKKKFKNIEILLSHGTKKKFRAWASRVSYSTCHFRFSTAFWFKLNRIHIPSALHNPELYANNLQRQPHRRQSFNLAIAALSLSQVSKFFPFSFSSVKPLIPKPYVSSGSTSGNSKASLPQIVSFHFCILHIWISIVSCCVHINCLMNVSTKNFQSWSFVFL